jgi:hypothetical protein
VFVTFYLLFLINEEKKAVSVWNLLWLVFAVLYVPLWNPPVVVDHWYWADIGLGACVAVFLVSEFWRRK